jgi:hypothetical protein
MPATKGPRPRDDLYYLIGKPTASEWRGIMRELLDYRTHEPTNRDLIERLKQEFGLETTAATHAGQGRGRR